MRRHGRARSEGHTAWVKYYQSPTDGFVINYWNPAPAGEREALTSQNQTAKNWAAQYSGVLRSNWSMEAAFASYSSQLFASIIQGFSDTLANVPQQENFDVFLWNGSTYAFLRSVRVGGSDFTPNTSLKPYRLDEGTVAFQRQFGQNMGAGIRSSAAAGAT